MKKILIKQLRKNMHELHPIVEKLLERGATGNVVNMLKQMSIESNMYKIPKK